MLEARWQRIGCPRREQPVWCLHPLSHQPREKTSTTASQSRMTGVKQPAFTDRTFTGKKFRRNEDFLFAMSIPLPPICNIACVIRMFKVKSQRHSPSWLQS